MRQPQLRLILPVDMFPVAFRREVLPFPLERFDPSGPGGKIYYLGVENHERFPARECTAALGFVRNDQLKTGIGLWLTSPFAKQPVHRYDIAPGNRTPLICFAVTSDYIWYTPESPKGWKQFGRFSAAEAAALRLIVGVGQGEVDHLSVTELSIHFSRWPDARPETAVAQGPIVVPEADFASFCGELIAARP